MPTTEVQRQPGAVYFENTAGPVLQTTGAGRDLSRRRLAGEAHRSRDGRDHQDRRHLARADRPKRRQVVVVEGGFFVVYESGEVVAFDNDFNKAPINIGTGGFIVDAGVGQQGLDRRRLQLRRLRRQSSGTKPTSAGTTGASIELARSAFPVAAIERGLIWQTPSGIFIGRSRSGAKRYATGTLVGARGDTVVWFGCDDITGIDCRYNVGDGRDSDQASNSTSSTTVSRPSASYLERLGTFPLSRDSIALPRSSDARLPLLNIETGRDVDAQHRIHVLPCARRCNGPPTVSGC